MTFRLVFSHNFLVCSSVEFFVSIYIYVTILSKYFSLCIMGGLRRSLGGWGVAPSSGALGADVEYQAVEVVVSLPKVEEDRDRWAFLSSPIVLRCEERGASSIFKELERCLKCGLCLYSVVDEDRGLLGPVSWWRDWRRGTKLEAFSLGSWRLVVDPGGTDGATLYVVGTMDGVDQTTWDSAASLQMCHCYLLDRGDWLSGSGEREGPLGYEGASDEALLVEEITCLSTFLSASHWEFCFRIRASMAQDWNLHKIVAMKSNCATVVMARGQDAVNGGVGGQNNHETLRGDGGENGSEDYGQLGCEEPKGEQSGLLGKE
uniref:Phosphate acyltransferase n=1 Tax=Anthurium amnicola TaxID=1678845 RepID=A0A1D1YDJ8_9ARAE